jgi:hypothetical protein
MVRYVLAIGMLCGTLGFAPTAHAQGLWFGGIGYGGPGWYGGGFGSPGWYGGGFGPYGFAPGFFPFGFGSPGWYGGYAPVRFGYPLMVPPVVVARPVYVARPVIYGGLVPAYAARPAVALPLNRAYRRAWRRGW